MMESINLTVQRPKLTSGDKNKLMEIFLDALKEMHWTELAHIQMLPMLAKGAASPELTATFDLHTAQSEEHLAKLTTIFNYLSIPPESRICMAMKELMDKSVAILRNSDPHTLSRDLGLIMAARKVEMFEMATYNALSGIAVAIDLYEASDVLLSIYRQENETAQILGRLSGWAVNT
jgi:ferritin-like metal-binding protein YciE